MAGDDLKGTNGLTGSQGCFPRSRGRAGTNPVRPIKPSTFGRPDDRKSGYGLRFARIDAHVIKFHALWPYVGINALGCSPVSTHGNSQN